MTNKLININEHQEHETPSIKDMIQDLCDYNDSMFTTDLNHIPRFTDGTKITAQDVADYNIQQLGFIVDLLGIELKD